MFDNNPEFLTAADDRRLELAARAAALIVDDGMSWAEARERITGDLRGARRAQCPSSAEIKSAVRERHAVFNPEEHAALLKKRRLLALDVLERVFAGFDAWLTGAVLNGAATEESNIALAIFCDDVKSVEVALMNANLTFEAMESVAGPMPEPLETIAVLIPDGRERVGCLIEVHSTKSIGINPFKREPDSHQKAWEAAGRITAAKLRQELI